MQPQPDGEDELDVSCRSLRLTNEIGRIETENTGMLEIATHETRLIAWLKLFVLCMLLAIAAVMTWLTYSLSRAPEKSSFESTFENQAERLIDTFHKQSANFLFTGAGIVSAFASAEDSFYFGTHPNVTWATYEAMMSPTRQMTQVLSISWAPLLHTEEERLQWEHYIVYGQFWQDYSIGETDTDTDTNIFTDTETDTSTQQPQDAAYWEGRDIKDGIFDFYDNLWPIRSNKGPPYSPIWQSTPLLETRPSILLDQLSEPVRAKALTQMYDLNISSFSGFLKEPFESKISRDYQGQRTVLFTPFHNDGGEILGSFQLTFDWATVFANQVGFQHSLFVVLENTCGEAVTYFVEGKHVTYLGEGDLQNTGHENYEKTSSLKGIEDQWRARFDQTRVTGVFLDRYFSSDRLDETCRYSIRVYPSDEFATQFYTMRPAIYSASVALVFLLCVLMVYLYNFLVDRRQSKVMNQAVEARNIVDSMFPSAFRDRLFRNRRQEEDGTGFFAMVAPPKIRLTTLLNDDSNGSTSITRSTNPLLRLEEPIAEMFSNTTVIFADIAGFTAWSSEREPSQVFELLETLYRQFDLVAKRLGVFKVETIGDCYVAVTGLPESNKDHAIVCARFAWEVMRQMGDLTKALEVSLGPGTSDLALRIGLHSGSVTAGVLRGDKARFQLFGDTMNTASRMESTGQTGKIQVSAETACLLSAAGKTRWLSKRERLVSVKGKGDMQVRPISVPGIVFVISCSLFSLSIQTFWLDPQRQQRTSSLDNYNNFAPESHGSARNWKELGLDSPLNLKVAGKLERLIDWNVEVLISRLAKVVTKRNKAALIGGLSPRRQSRGRTNGQNLGRANEQPVSAVSEVLELPRFDPRVARRQSINTKTTNTSTINQAVRTQLRAYVARIARYYKDVPFHNFEHASHVALSANKLIKRIIAPEDVDYNKDGTNNGERMESLASDLHHSTFGISSDPLTHFVVVFAALVHDVDHTGVPNAQLVKEEDPIAVRYHNKSVAEQHSVQLALETLAEPQYGDLQNCIYANNYEENRFRQLVINSVMATDIVDRDLDTLRKNRWTKAFHSANCSHTMEEHVNRKATIVIEHIIQASDVAHTMQHWHVFCKWNEKLYNEMYAAYLCGRSAKDPSIDWYDSEIGFFDHYIIPLAKKLQECGIFGVSSDEYLQYALANRQEWAIKGRQVTKEMIIRRMNFFGQAKPSSTVPRNLLPIHSSSSSTNSSPASSKSYLPTPGTAGPARDLINIGLPLR